MPGKQAKVVTPQMLRRMLRRTSSAPFPARDRVMILLSVKAGLRACEIAQLEWSMILDARGKVADSLAIHDAIAKKRGGRRIPMHPDLRKALQSLLRMSEPSGPVVRIAREPAPHPSPLQKRLDWLAQTCSLNAAQSRVLGLLARAVSVLEVRRLVEAIDDRFHADGLELEPFLETNSERLELSARGKSSELSLIDAQNNSSLPLVVDRFLSLPRFGPNKLGNLLLGEPAHASLTWKDFEHLGDLRDLASRIVAGAGCLRGPAPRGVNLLF